MSVLVDGMGGINADGIRFVFEIEKIKDNGDIAQKLITYVSAALKTQHKETGSEQRNKTKSKG